MLHAHMIWQCSSHNTYAGMAPHATSGTDNGYAGFCEEMPPHINPRLFRNLDIAITGDFGGDRTIGKQKDWIQAHGGRYSRFMSSHVTHMVCSEEHYKQKVALGELATLSHGFRTVHLRIEASLFEAKSG